MTKEKLGYLIGKALGAFFVGLTVYFLISFKVSQDLAYATGILTSVIVFWSSDV